MARIDNDTNYPPAAIDDGQEMLAVMADGSTGKVTADSILSALDGRATDAELTAHVDATTSVHGIPDTSALLTTADIGGSVASQAALDGKVSKSGDTMTGPLVLPANSGTGAVNQAARITQRDPATGQLQIDGKEMGVIGPVILTDADLLNGWKISNSPTAPRYWRQGNTVFFVGQLDPSGATDTTAFNVPAWASPVYGSGAAAGVSSGGTSRVTVRLGAVSFAEYQQLGTVACTFSAVGYIDSWPTSI